MEFNKEVSNKIEEIGELTLHFTMSFLESDYFFDKTIDKKQKSEKCLKIVGQALKCLSHDNIYLKNLHKKLINLVNNTKFFAPKDKLIFDLMVNCNDEKSYELFKYADDLDQAIMLKHAFHILQLRSEPNKSMKCLAYLLNLNADKKNYQKLPFLEMFNECDLTSKLRYHLHDFENHSDLVPSITTRGDWQNNTFNNVFHYFSKNYSFKNFIIPRFHKNIKNTISIGLDELVFTDVFQRKFDYNFTKEIVKNIISIPKENIAARLQHLSLNGDKNLKLLRKFLNTNFKLNEDNYHQAYAEIALAMLIKEKDFAYNLDDSFFNWIKKYDDCEISNDLYYLWSTWLDINRSNKWASHVWDDDFRLTQSEFPSIFGQNGYDMHELFQFNRSNKFVNHDYLENKLLYGKILNYKMDFKSLLLHPNIKTFGKLECCIFMMKSIFMHKELYDKESIDNDEPVLFDDYLD